MALIDVDTRLEVEKQIEDKAVVQGFRPYLGISGIAHPCARALWYSFRMCSMKTITPRLDRLFQRGHREEAIIKADLLSIGMIHYNDQEEIVTGHGHIKGHTDGTVIKVPDAPKTPHLSEFKTHNAKSFKDLKAKGVTISKPIHYGQMICYMKELNLTRGLYIAVCKDNDERYYERISSNDSKAQELLDRGVGIISTETPPEKQFKSTWFECKWCDHYELCHFGEAPLSNCRTCQFGDILDEGLWACSKLDINLTFEQQQIECKHYSILRTLG